jgi:hypothetical protein
MNKPKLLKPVNAIMAIAFVCLVLSALLRDAMPFPVYSKVHPLFGFVLTACVLFHVFLNWNWVKANFLPALKREAADKNN